MKVRSSIKKIDPDDQIVKRRGRLYVINKKKPRNKQRQGWIFLFLIVNFDVLSLDKYPHRNLNEKRRYFKVRLINKYR